MKEEEYRDLQVAGIIGVKKRLSLNDIIGFTTSYRDNPGTSAGIGQMVFAMYTGPICMGMCVSGASLTPWALRCTMCENQSSGCGSNACATNGFSLGTGTYVALGGGGDIPSATVWRRIS